MVTDVKRPWWWWAPRRPRFAWATVVLFGIGCLVDVLALVLQAGDPDWRLLMACIFGAGAIGSALSLVATRRVVSWEQREL